MKNCDDKHRKDIFTNYLKVRQANLKITCINHTKKKKNRKDNQPPEQSNKETIKNKNKRKQKKNNKTKISFYNFF